MFLSAAFWFVPWEDTFRFHARLFRCFILGLLDAHGDLTFGSRGLERMWAILGQRLVDVSLGHDAGHLRGHEFAPTRCPPRRRYEVTSWSQIVTNPLMDQTVPVHPFIPQLVPSHNITRGLHDEPVAMHSAVADIPGSVTGISAGVAVCVVLLLFTLVIVVLRSRAPLDFTRAVCQLSRVAVDSTTERATRCLPWDPLTMHEAVADTHDEIGHRASMPGAWFHERQKHSMLEGSALDTMPWMLFRTRAQMGIDAWAHLSGLTWISATLDPLNRGPNDEVTIGRQFDDNCSPRMNEFDFDRDVLTPVALGRTKRLGASPDRLPSEFGHSVRNFRDLTPAVHSRRRESSAIGDVAVKDPHTATLYGICGDQTFHEASRSVGGGSNQEDMSFDGDESASEDGSNGELFPRHADEKKGAYRVLGRRQDGALSDTGCPLSLRRARSTGHLWRQRNDERSGSVDNSYWTERVDARLSGERGSYQAPCRYGWTDGSSWPREGQTDNWRTGNSHFIPEQSQAKFRRYSSPPLSVDVSSSHRAGRERLQGIYVVPQRRGSRCWSPVSSPRPSGLGFFPFRKTPSLLTPKAWRPGCLYVPDPPADESRQADAWEDSLTRGSTSAGTGTEIEDVQPPFSRDAPVSWRDRCGNDPASRRIISVHRRAMTEG